MSRKKLLKPILFGVLGVGAVSLVLGLSINWSHTQYLSAVGSSGVKPFISALGTQYHNSHKQFDVAVESGGTTFAVEQVSKGYAQIGNASNNPYYTIFPESGTSEYSSKWAGKKTLTLGWEGIFVLYKMPNGLSQEAQNHFDIQISKDNILDLYAVFSGFNESMNNGEVEVWDANKAKAKNSMFNYLSPDSQNWFTANPTQKEIVDKTPITPFLRSGGNTGANSSIAFTYYSNLADYAEMTPRQQNAFKGGQYGHAHKFYETDESNAQCWNLFSSFNLPGSMTYMSTGFLAYENNRNLLKQMGYKVASYLPKDSTTPIKILSDDCSELYTDNICKTSGYNWYRPINVMIDLNVQKSKDFIYWIYTGKNKDQEVFVFDIDTTPLKKVMYSNGAKPINTAQFNTMLTPQSSNDENIYTRLLGDNASDFKISETRSNPDDKKVYGSLEEWGGA